jgi:HK97 gp10 family phage protein
MSVHLTSRIGELSAEVEQKTGMVIRKGALDILSESHDDVPVKTGHLKSTGHIVEVSPTRAEIRYDADYALYVEEGTRHMRAQPFLKPAFDHVEPMVMAAIKALVK